MSEIKVDALSTVSGSGNLTVDTDTLVVDTTNEKIGINQASPTYQLTVKAATQSTVEIESASTTGESRLYMTDPDSTGVGEIGYYHNGDTMRFATGGVERMRLSSAGLHIGGTGSANALDDYEEGTFTPAYTSGVSGTYQTQLGTYTKVGRLVYVEILLDGNSMSGNGNQLKIGGLPFVSQNANASNGGLYHVYTGGTYDGGNTTTWLVNRNESVVYAYNVSGSTWKGNQMSDLNGGYRIAGFYQAA